MIKASSDTSLRPLRFPISAASAGNRSHRRLLIVDVGFRMEHTVGFNKDDALFVVLDNPESAVWIKAPFFKEAYPITPA